MTRKEQVKILDDKIKANNAQYDLDRMNAEISAYSSGDLHKYEYLTKKKLGYKPNAFEQAKFEYSPLGKVFIDGLNKSDKKEGLLKRLKNIESKNNNQLLALRNINRPAIRGRDNYDSDDDDSDDDDDDDDYDDDDDDVNNEYKKIIEDYKNNKIKRKEIEKQINKIKNAIKIYKKNQKAFKNIPDIKNRINKNKKLAKMLKEFLDKRKIIDISWIDDPELFNQINNDVTNRYRKDKNSTELLSIQDFLDDINDEYIENKDDAREKFKNLKNDVKSDELKDIVKELEHSIFGYEELSGSGLKILTNKQMLNRLPILLAQIQAGNNSSKLKNEARQILCSLYRSKELTKTVHNNLIKAIRSKELRQILYSLYRSKELTKTVYNNLIKTIRSKELNSAVRA